jgi:hypothetical protein
MAGSPQNLDGALVSILQTRQTEYKRILSGLLKAKRWRFGEELSLVPNCHGVYALSEIGAPVGEYLHAGRTEDGQDGLRGRMNEHRNCSTSDDLLIKLKRYGRCQSIEEARIYIRKNCQAQWVQVEDLTQRIWLERYILALLQPIWSK